MLINRVTLLGHKDHGKSTLIGSMLMATHSVTETRINEAKKISDQLGRKFEPAYILDSFSEEREGEMTIDITRAQINYKDNAFEFIDVPGHEELIKNMMSGASYADFALLLVSAKSDEGIRDQTKRHLFLAKMMGIRRIVVAVNKMDTIDYSQKKFNEIKGGLTSFLEKVGFDKKNVAFVPISAYDAVNLIGKSSKLDWYNGEPLLDELISFATPKRAKKADDMRVVMQGVMPGAEDVAVGRVICGVLSVGDKVKMPPMEREHTVKEIIVKGKSKKSAAPGENVALRFDKALDFDPRGSVMCRSSDSVRAKNRIEALVFTVKELGSSTRLRFNGREMDCDVAVNALVDVTTGAETPGDAIPPLSAGRATIEVAQQIVSEPFDKRPELGRFVLYDNDGFAGIGIITS